MITNSVTPQEHHQPRPWVWAAQVGAFDWLMVVLSTFFVSGLLLDGWAHAHGKVDNSFFTPWHAVFYSGFGLVACLLAADTGLALLRGEPFSLMRRSGYELAYLGTPLFALGGVGDLVWHQLFGIERGIEALLSPTHLLLVTSMLMIVSAPFRSPDPAMQAQRWPGQLRRVLSLTLALTLLSFITEFANPIVEPQAQRSIYRSAEAIQGITAFLVYPALLMGATLVLIRRGRPMPGALMLMYSLHAVGLSVLNDTYWAIGVAALTGFIADVLVAVLRPSVKRRIALHGFAFCIPAVFALSYMLTLMQIERVIWRVHLWGGAVFIAGATGLLLSLLVVQPEEA